MKKDRTETKKKREKEELPDYTVADMNVEGMPWNTGRHWRRPDTPDGSGSRPERRRQELSADSDREADQTSGKKPWEIETSRYTKEESRQMVWLGIKAGLVIGGVFLAGALVFILFCLYVWF